MTWRCWFGLKWLCPFRRPRRPALLEAPQQSRRDFEHARDRLIGAALDSVDTAEFAARAAVQARNSVRKVGERVDRRVEDSPIMRAANEAAHQLSRHRGVAPDA